MAHAARLNRSGPDGAARDWIVAAAPIPFEELLADVVDDTIGQLEAVAGPAVGLLSLQARAVLCRALLGRLSDITLATLMSEFALYRALHQPLPGAMPARGDAAYRGFVAANLPIAQSPAMAHYPGLAALLRDQCRNWAQSQGEMLLRLAADWPAMCNAFDLGPVPGVASLAPYRSDPHDRGRAVSLLGCVNGRVLVYKPRSVAMEHALDALLAWANGHGFSQVLRRPAIAVRNGYGWMEHVVAAPCRNAAQVRAYHHRIGGLIALVTLFQGTDIHLENLVAAGEHPVIVDAETLLHPRLCLDFARALGPGAMRARAPDDFAQALDECGFLPRPGEPDFSALGAIGAVDTPFPQPRCVGVNRDTMTIEHAPYRAAARDNIAMLDGAPQHAARHAEAIVAGYAEMIALALEHRTTLIGIARSFAGIATRTVVRSTNSYGLLLNASLAPAMLRDRAARAALFDRLSQAAAASTCDDILEQERRALLRLDVPHLTYRCDTASPGWPAPLDQVLDRIAALRPQDIATNAALLRARLARIDVQ